MQHPPVILKPRKALNKAFLKVKPNRTEIERFKTNLTLLLDHINENESEEFHKNLVADFLKKTYYDPVHFINTKGRNDLVIHNSDKPSSSVGVIIETKKPGNKSEMLTRENLNTKAFHELILYYLRERLTHNNLEVRYLIATNIYEWFIFDATLFERFFTQDKGLEKHFAEFEAGRLTGVKTDFFYKQVAEPFVNSLNHAVEFTYFDIRDFEKPLRNTDRKDDNALIALFKLLSPQHLLKLPFANDSNSLDKRFYTELLHIIGLAESKEGGKKVISRKPEKDRDPGSFIENAVIQLDSLDKISRLDQPSRFGATNPERLFNVALELSITWMNRILFLKLLEAQLISYHKDDPAYAFLNLKTVGDYDGINRLFFQVLARKKEERGPDLKTSFARVPYLNSSLFEPTDLEHTTLFISNLSDDTTLAMHPQTVLKDGAGKKRAGHLHPLQYLFEFLDAYDFAGDGSEEIQEENKTLINASVLGLIFEKINGYKDGSFFTPGFITMYMCRETIRRAVLQKFNEAKGWDCADLHALYNRIGDLPEANRIINNLKICDPAVGSGHFLVSALNEIIAIKSDLKVLCDREGRRLKEYHCEVVNDELIITDEDGELFEYHPGNKESQRVQETLFHEKQTIIENCLFGVDINPNSVKICRLRLWIELLKNAYYKNETELETLPNIDINIKCGNSLISRFALDADLKQALRKSASKWTIDGYRVAVSTYRNAVSKEERRQMERLINEIKTNFRSEIASNDPKLKQLQGKKVELFELTNQQQLFALGDKEKAVWEAKLTKLTTEIVRLEAEIEEIRNNKIFENAFEWRFEFPEALNDDGDFVGFDVVIGNPPYIHSRSNFDSAFKSYVTNNYSSVNYQISTVNLFIEKGIKICRQNSFMNFIVPNYWLSTDNDFILRHFLFNKNFVQFIVNTFQVFEDAVVDTLILAVQKKHFASSYSTKLMAIDRNLKTIKDRLECINKRNWQFDTNHLVYTGNEDNKISFREQFYLKSKHTLKEFFELRFGAKLYEVGKGDPPQTSEFSKNKIYESKYKLDSTYIRLIRARNVKAYYVKDDEYYVKYGKNLAAQRDPNIFNGERILLQRIISGKKLDAAYINTNGICNTDIITLLPIDNKIDLFLFLGILCSKFCSYYIRSNNINLDRNAFPKINTNTLDNFPIPNYLTILNISDLTKSIIDSKKIDNQFDTSDLESQIDQLVYQLYDLTPEEIAIVEEAVK